ncbi:MAG: glycerol-3-phosphate acyltransferase [SAR202 cluster bacterium]|nr:glycerol-3-phosphate acyltransferase [SAR202 cluster bacterium]
MIDITALYIGSYLLGSIPTAYIIGRLVKGVDIRGYGSGNVGGANLYEHVGKRWVVPLVAAEVLLKGALPILVGLYILNIDRSSAFLIGPPLLTIAGNNWSAFLKLQGGRGITVAVGTMLALSPLLLVVFAVIAVGGWVITKSSGLWVLISLALLPLWAYLQQDNLNLVWYYLGMLGIVALKRLSANWTPFPEDVSRKKVLLNRLVRDRDLSDRTGWVRRVPEGSS